MLRAKRALHLVKQAYCSLWTTAMEFCVIRSISPFQVSWSFIEWKDIHYKGSFSLVFFFEILESSTLHITDKNPKDATNAIVFVGDAYARDKIPSKCKIDVIVSSVILIAVNNCSFVFNKRKESNKISSRWAIQANGATFIWKMEFYQFGLWTTAHWPHHKYIFVATKKLVVDDLVKNCIVCHRNLGENDGSMGWVFYNVQLEYFRASESVKIKIDSLM